VIRYVFNPQHQLTTCVQTGPPFTAAAIAPVSLPANVSTHKSQSAQSKP
jgi:hypothetical protein